MRKLTYLEKKERFKRLEIRRQRFQNGDVVYCIKDTISQYRDNRKHVDIVVSKNTRCGNIYTVDYNIKGNIKIKETNEYIHHSRFISLHEYRLLKIKKIKKQIKKMKNGNSDDTRRNNITTL